MRGRSAERVPNWLIGVLLIVVLAVGSYLAFTKNVPWGGGTEVTAVFRSAQNLRPNSPVRIAGWPIPRTPGGSARPARRRTAAAPW